MTLSPLRITKMDGILAYEAVAIFVNRLIMLPVCVESDKMPPHHHHYVAAYMLTWDFFNSYHMYC